MKKVIKTILVLVFSITLYTISDELGKLAIENNLYLTADLLVWAWLLLGQIVVLKTIWR